MTLAALLGAPGGEARSPTVDRTGRLWRRIARLHGAPTAHVERAEQIVRAVAEAEAPDGRPLSVAIVAGSWGARAVLGPQCADAITLGVAPHLHVVVLRMAGPRALVALRADRAGRLAPSGAAMLRVGAAWGVGHRGAQLLDAASESLALAGGRVDGFGPLLGGDAADA